MPSTTRSKAVPRNIGWTHADELNPLSAFLAK
jgi:hypothetical protein